jgi:hypothetical protein
MGTQSVPYERLCEEDLGFLRHCMRTNIPLMSRPATIVLGDTLDELTATVVEMHKALLDKASLRLQGSGITCSIHD